MSKISIDTVAAEKRSVKAGMDLYVHIPFCTEICSFCAFHRKVGNSFQQEAYTKALEAHIDDVLTPFGSDQKISSIFVGGGTPGLLSLGQAGRIISKINDRVDIADAKTTYELHPENVAEEYIRGLEDIGIKRFSIGVQTLSDEERKAQGRDLTTSNQDLATLRTMNQLGVAYNLDLMFGTPTQTIASWVDTLKRITGEVNPPEITIYQFVNAHGSETRKWIAQGIMTRPDFKTRKAMYDQALREMASAGYRQTSTYSFSRDGSVPDRALLSHGTDFLGLGPRTYSKIGRHLFINDARIADFKLGGNMADYVGVSIPPSLMVFSDKTFGFFASGKEPNNTSGLVDLRSLKSEAVSHVYGVLYYITNQPRLSRRT